MGVLFSDMPPESKMNQMHQQETEPEEKSDVLPRRRGLLRFSSDNAIPGNTVNMENLRDLPPLDQAASCPLDIEPIKHFTVRPCQVQDTESIDYIMREAWPDEPEWRKLSITKLHYIYTISYNIPQDAFAYDKPSILDQGVYQTVLTALWICN